MQYKHFTITNDTNNNKHYDSFGIFVESPTGNNADSFSGAYICTRSTSTDSNDALPSNEKEQNKNINFNTNTNINAKSSNSNSNNIKFPECKNSVPLIPPKRARSQSVNDKHSVKLEQRFNFTSPTTTDNQQKQNSVSNNQKQSVQFKFTSPTDNQQKQKPSSGSIWGASTDGQQKQNSTDDNKQVPQFRFKLKPSYEKPKFEYAFNKPQWSSSRKTNQCNTTEQLNKFTNESIGDKSAEIPKPSLLESIPDESMSDELFVAHCEAILKRKRLLEYTISLKNHIRKVLEKDVNQQYLDDFKFLLDIIKKKEKMEYMSVLDSTKLHIIINAWNDSHFVDSDINRVT